MRRGDCFFWALECLAFFEYFLLFLDIEAFLEDLEVPECLAWRFPDFFNIADFLGIK